MWFSCVIFIKKRSFLEFVIPSTDIIKIVFVFQTIPPWFCWPMLTVTFPSNSFPNLPSTLSALPITWPLKHLHQQTVSSLTRYSPPPDSSALLTNFLQTVRTIEWFRRRKKTELYSWAYILLNYVLPFASHYRTDQFEAWCNSRRLQWLKRDHVLALDCSHQTSCDDYCCLYDRLRLMKSLVIKTTGWWKHW